VIRRLILRTTCLAGLICTSANGAVYEVGPDRPYKTLRDVAALLLPGDTAKLDGGHTYPGGVTLRAGGTAGAGVITIEGVGPDRPVLSGIADDCGAVLRVMGSHYVISGIAMTAGGQKGARRGFYNVGDDVTLRDSVVHDCLCTGISNADAAGSLTLDHVEVYHCGDGLYAHQIYVGSGVAQYPQALFRMQNCHVHDGTGGNDVKSRVTRNEIVCNRIEGAAFHLLDLDGPDPKAQQSPANLHCDADIVGNVFVATGAGAVARLGSDGTGVSRGRYRFAANTVIIRSSVTAGLGVFWIKGEVDALSLWNNVFWSAVGPVRLTRMEGTPVLAGGGNWFLAGTKAIPSAWAGIQGTDPGFVNPAANDYRPAPGSPLLGRGCAVPSPALVPPSRQPGHEKDIGALL
jgi:hypothetical protein